MARRKIEALKHPEKSHPASAETRKKMSEYAKKHATQKQIDTRFGGKNAPPRNTRSALQAKIYRGDFWLDFFSNIISTEELARYGQNDKEREKILRSYCRVFKKQYTDDVIQKTLGEQRAYALSYDRAIDFDTEKWVIDRVEGKSTFKIEAQVENNDRVFIRGFALPDDDAGNIMEEI